MKARLGTVTEVDAGQDAGSSARSFQASGEVTAVVGHRRRHGMVGRLPWKESGGSFSSFQFELLPHGQKSRTPSAGARVVETKEKLSGIWRNSLLLYLLFLLLCFHFSYLFPPFLLLLFFFLRCFAQTYFLLEFGFFWPEGGCDRQSPVRPPLFTTYCVLLRLPSSKLLRQ